MAFVYVFFTRRAAMLMVDFKQAGACTNFAGWVGASAPQQCIPGAIPKYVFARLFEKYFIVHPGEAALLNDNKHY